VHKWLLLFLLLTACQVNDCGVEPTVEFEVQQMGIYDDGDNMTSYRNPVSTVVSTTSTGGTLLADPSFGK